MTELIDLPEVSEENYPAIFCTGGLKPFIDAALSEAELIKKELPDVSTKKGREAIGAAALKVSKSKTAIEKPGAIYIKKIKAEGVAVAAELSAFKKAMDSIRDDVQAPLIAYKDAEKVRIEKLEVSILMVRGLSVTSNPVTGDVFTSEFLKDVRAGASVMEFDPDEFGDMHEEVMSAWSDTLESLDESIKRVSASEEMQAENERLKAEAAETKRLHDLDEAKRQGAAAAEKAAAAEIAAAELREKKAVEKTLEDVRRQDANKAADAKAKEEAEKRASEDVNHRKTVNNLALNELMQCCPGLTNDQAMNIVKGLASNKFTDLTINY